MSESKEGWAERRAATRREWDRIIGEFEATGMTGAAFCRDRGFPVSVSPTACLRGGEGRVSQRQDPQSGAPIVRG